MKRDRHLFESFTSRINYGGDLALCGHTLEVLSWKIAKHGSASSTLEILYVCRERRVNSRHRASPTTFAEVGAVQGLMTPKVREFRRVFRDKQLTPRYKGETENEGVQPRAVPQTGN
jgi:hypothetical protein